MAKPTDKASLVEALQEGFLQLMDVLKTADHAKLEADFLRQDKNEKCTTFSQGENVRDLLTHIYEWQRLQVSFVDNIRKGTPRDFIQEPYRKNYKEMDEVNRLKHQKTSLDQAIIMLEKSHAEIISLIDTFTDEELFGKKVFRVTYTTTMAAYFVSVAVSPYSQSLKRIKSHLKSMR